MTARHHTTTTNYELSIYSYLTNRIRPKIEASLASFATIALASLAIRALSYLLQILTTSSFDDSPTTCYRGCAIMTGKTMYDAVTQAASATGPSISTRYTELLETSVTRTKQTTEITSTRYKTGYLSNAIRLTVTRVKSTDSASSCSAGPFDSAQGRPLLVRHRGVPHHAPCGHWSRTSGHRSRTTGRWPRATDTAFLIGTPKRLKTAATQTKQTTETVSNRYNLRGVSQIQLDGKSLADSHGHLRVARVSCPGERRVRPEAFEFRPYSNAPKQGATLS
jgi:hypothetical protein